MKEKKARVEDALNATRAAVEEGIVPGGGVALLRAQSALDKLKVSEEQQAGVRIDPRARSKSRSVRSPPTPVSKVRSWWRRFAAVRARSAYNAATDEYTDLIEAGVIDPTKVVRCALQNAASVASLMLTTEAMIAEKPKEKAAGGHGHSHGGMPDMDM